MRRASTSPAPASRTHEAWALLPRRHFAAAAGDDSGALARRTSAVIFFTPVPRDSLHSRVSLGTQCHLDFCRQSCVLVRCRFMLCCRHPKCVSPPFPRGARLTLTHRTACALTFATFDSLFFTGCKGVPLLCDGCHILCCRPNGRPEVRPERRAAALRLLKSHCARNCARESCGDHMRLGENTRARGAARVDRVRMLE